MSQVSRRPIKPELSARMDELLWKSLNKMGTADAALGFLEEVLTSTERVMLAKRLAIALLLDRGWDHDAISRYLKVSTSTVTGIKTKLAASKNGYRRLINQIKNSREWELLSLDLKQALEEILAGRAGVNWKQTKPAVFKKYAAKRAKYRLL